MNKHDEPYAQALQAAQDAIEDNEHRERLLKELWEGLGLSEQARDLIFQPSDPVLLQAAEQELLKQVQRMRDRLPAIAQEGQRPRRPPRMRGLLA